MSMTKLRRVMWRLIELKQESFPMKDLRRAIFFEVGTCETTITKTINDLKELHWLKCAVPGNGRTFSIVKEHEPDFAL